MDVPVTAEPESADVTSWVVASLEGIDAALYQAYKNGPLRPFTHEQTVKPGAETFLSSDRQILLIRQYDIHFDRFVWRVSAQRLESSPEGAK